MNYAKNRDPKFWVKSEAPFIKQKDIKFFVPTSHIEIVFTFIRWVTIEWDHVYYIAAEVAEEEGRHFHFAEQIVVKKLQEILSNSDHREPVFFVVTIGEYFKIISVEDCYSKYVFAEDPKEKISEKFQTEWNYKLQNRKQSNYRFKI